MSNLYLITAEFIIITAHGENGRILMLPGIRSENIIGILDVKRNTLSGRCATRFEPSKYNHLSVKRKFGIRCQWIKITKKKIVTETRKKFK